MKLCTFISSYRQLFNLFLDNLVTFMRVISIESDLMTNINFLNNYIPYQSGFITLHSLTHLSLRYALSTTNSTEYRTEHRHTLLHQLNSKPKLIYFSGCWL